MTETVGILAGAFTVTTIFPQIWKIWRTRQTQDLSYASYLLLSIGAGLWAIYGWLLGNWPVTVTNLIVFGSATTVLLLKFRLESKR